MYKPIELHLFFIGFFFPLAWFIGSTEKSCCCCCRQPISPGTQTKNDPRERLVEKWRKRNRIAATLFLTSCIVAAVLIMILKPSTFGLLASNTSADTSSATKTATRPGVPVDGSSAWGDAVAGIGVTSIGS
ncbi:hypothetical protein BC941DRAFT_455145 [Chlamydoabsidia padenii]|nr:hypothetical protein BC941DRAFT_455145 [Chlamydoabsidia padenii]